jgi:hypothetical protein
MHLFKTHGDRFNHLVACSGDWWWRTMGLWSLWKREHANWEKVLKAPRRMMSDEWRGCRLITSTVSVGNSKSDPWRPRNLDDVCRRNCSRFTAEAQYQILFRAKNIRHEITIRPPGSAESKPVMTCLFIWWCFWASGRSTHARPGIVDLFYPPLEFFERWSLRRSKFFRHAWSCEMSAAASARQSKWHRNQRQAGGVYAVIRYRLRSQSEDVERRFLPLGSPPRKTSDDCISEVDQRTFGFMFWELILFICRRIFLDSYVECFTAQNHWGYR